MVSQAYACGLMQSHGQQRGLQPPDFCRLVSRDTLDFIREFHLIILYFLFIFYSLFFKKRFYLSD